MKYIFSFLADERIIFRRKERENLKILNFCKKGYIKLYRSSITR